MVSLEAAEPHMKSCNSLQETLSHKRRMKLVGVADPDNEAQGIILAQSLKIPTYQDCNVLLAKKTRSDSGAYG